MPVGTDPSCHEAHCDVGAKHIQAGLVGREVGIDDDLNGVEDVGLQRVHASRPGPVGGNEGASEDFNGIWQG